MAPKVKEKETVTLEQVLIWIIENNKNRDAMDKISITTFPYTTKYSEIYNRGQNPEGNKPY